MDVSTYVSLMLCGLAFGVWDQSRSSPWPKGQGFASLSNELFDVGMGLLAGLMLDIFLSFFLVPFVRFE